MIEKPLRLINGCYDDDEDEDHSSDNQSSHRNFNSNQYQMNNLQQNSDTGPNQKRDLSMFQDSPDKDFEKLESQIQLQRKDEKIEELY